METPVGGEGFRPQPYQMSVVIPTATSAALARGVLPPGCGEVNHIPRS